MADNNNEIIGSLKEKLDLNEIKTTDIALVELTDLKEVLADYMNDTESLSENIIENAKFWKNYFENKL